MTERAIRQLNESKGEKLRKVSVSKRSKIVTFEGSGKMS